MIVFESEAKTVDANYKTKNQIHRYLHLPSLIMIISDSPLFKEYARPVLSPESRPARAFYSPFGIVDIVVQHLLDLAKLETTRFKISNATAE
jgi:hypothetical protein